MTDEVKQEVPKTDKASDLKGILSQLEVLLDEYMVTKAPFQIPDNGKELIVKIAPYLVIISAIIAVPALLAGLGLSMFLAPLALLGGHYGVAAFISLIFAAISLVIDIMAIPGLFARSKKGWRLTYYATVVGLVGSVFSFNIIGGIIGAIIGWYLLFQVKEKYAN
ncbi:MAG TPA: hypothetical protein VN420_00465 [Candidatus Fimivivens sp.]|nr:hypothetical protein [Candidatus Fimivivens sp.]